MTLNFFWPENFKDHDTRPQRINYFDVGIIYTKLIFVEECFK